MRLSRPFIRLPWRFDAAQLAAEALALPSAAWMPHPNGTAGNSAVALISSGGGDNDSFEGEKRATPHLAACQYMRQVMASFGVVLSRSRLMKLDAGAEVGLHVDFNYHWFSRVRIHIPVLTHPSVIFHCGAERLHMGAGECWLFDSWRRHNVVNPAPRERIHLVIDTAGSSSFWEMARSAAASDAEAVAATAQLVPFDREAHPKLNVERYSAPSVMAPGECAALVSHCGLRIQPNQRRALAHCLRAAVAGIRGRLAGTLASARANGRGHAAFPGVDRKDAPAAASQSSCPHHREQRHRRERGVRRAGVERGLGAGKPTKHGLRAGHGHGI